MRFGLVVRGPVSIRFLFAIDARGPVSIHCTRFCVTLLHAVLLRSGACGSARPVLPGLANWHAKVRRQPIKEPTNCQGNKYPHFKKGLALAEDLGVPITYERLHTLEEVIKVITGALCEDFQVACGSTSAVCIDCKYDLDNESCTSLFNHISEEIFEEAPIMSSAAPVYDKEDAVSLGLDFDLHMGDELNVSTTSRPSSNTQMVEVLQKAAGL
ncbi:hypothetical protein C8Q74DRAFT_1213803 [Fomes fomentarius]|nr:hypothetical protein C8Q74DRAFT_1213803 [Fomes fomentarius]